jgi:hypothetical protein
MPTFVAYITTWSGERPLSTKVIERPGRGIAYADETLTDRDDHGVLWRRVPSRPGDGRPQFGQVHPLRQRRAMRRLLCQVCGHPADQSDLGTLWLVPDYRDDWPTWPEHMACTEPPICRPCAPNFHPRLPMAAQRPRRPPRRPLPNQRNLRHPLPPRTGLSRIHPRDDLHLRRPSHPVDMRRPTGPRTTRLHQ